MAKVKCGFKECQERCFYNNGWWECPNGHGQKLETVEPEEEDKKPT